MNKNIIYYIGNSNPLFSSLDNIFLTLHYELLFISINKIGAFYLFENVETLPSIIIIEALNNEDEIIKKILWKSIRLKAEIIGYDMACLPVLVIGNNSNFNKSLVSKAFRAFPAQHQYITIPIRLAQLLYILDVLVPVRKKSLEIINKANPYDMKDMLEHDLNNISSYFNYSSTLVELERQFREIQYNFHLYENIQKDKRKVLNIRTEILKLDSEIMERRGETWKKKY